MLAAFQSAQVRLAVPTWGLATIELRLGDLVPTWDQPRPGLLPALGSQVDLFLVRLSLLSPCLGDSFEIAGTSLGPTF